MKTICYTSANLAYLDRAIVLRDTLARHHPDWPLILVLVEEEPRDSRTRSLLDGFSEVILASELGIPDYRRWIFKHDVVEACTGVKGPALVRLLQRDVDAVMYLDPDMAVFSPLVGAITGLEQGSVVLTPHQLTPETENWAVVDNEITSLRTGTYNFGFLGVRNDDEGRQFAEWWSNRLLDFCRDDPDLGLFTVQKWGDLVPVFFPQTHICRDPGMNVASWNLLQRPMTLSQGGQYLAAGATLQLFHFTKASSVGQLMTLKHAQGNVHVAEIWRWYLEKLAAANRYVGDQPWSYGHYGDGRPIEKQHRDLYRSRVDLQLVYPDPFTTRDRYCYANWVRLDEGS